MKRFLLLLILLVIIGAGIVWFLKYSKNLGDLLQSPSPSVTLSASPTASPTPNPGMLDQSVSDGTISLSYSSSDFGLATAPAQVPVTSYIPPCEQGFNYCLYYKGSIYSGTNFESAGLRIQTRPDLKTQPKCLTAQPNGYSGIKSSTNAGNGYATSVFSPLGDAAAGHYSSGAQYRLWTGTACYEFETRVGQTQFANYPAGTVKEFTAADLAAVNAKLRRTLESLMLKNGTQVVFPQAQ